MQVLCTRDSSLLNKFSFVFKQIKTVVFTLVWWLISLNGVARKNRKGSKSELTDLDMQQVFEEFMEELGLGFGGKKIGKN